MADPKRGNRSSSSNARAVANDPRSSARIERAKQPLTTNQGLAIAENQNSLKLATRGPRLLEDFILREKITHFDHERIPERIVHARGSGAHGSFQVYAGLRSRSLGPARFAALKAMAFGAGALALLRGAGMDVEDASRMVGVISSSRVGFDEDALAAFVAAIAAHRAWERVV